MPKKRKQPQGNRIGRPATGRTTVSVTVSLNAQLLVRINQLCEAMDLDRSSLISDLILKSIEPLESDVHGMPVQDIDLERTAYFHARLVADLEGIPHDSQEFKDLRQQKLNELTGANLIRKK